MKKLSVLLVVALVAASLLLAGFAKNSSQEALKANSPKAQNTVQEAPKEAVKSEPSTTELLHDEVAEPEVTKAKEKATEKTTQKPSEKSVPPAQTAEVTVTKEDAKAAALQHAGVKEADIRNYKVEVDKERNGTVYEIEFDAGKYEYDYVINAETGKIVHSEVEKERESAQVNNNKNNTTTKAPEQAVAEPKVTKDEAKAAALKHAGLAEKDVVRFKAELDKERNGLVYEIEFNSGKYEYEYEVSAENGKVLKHEKEFRD